MSFEPIVVDMEIEEISEVVDMELAEEINVTVIQGTDVSDTTAVESDVKTGKTFHKANGDLATGTLVLPPDPVLDDSIYLLRALPYTSYLKRLQKIIGGTVAWNQLLDGSVDANWAASNATKSFSDGICTFTASAKDGYVQLNVERTVESHVYLAVVDIKETTASNLVALNWYGGEYKYCEATTNWQRVASISKRSVSNNNFKMRVSDRRTSGWDAVQVKNFMLFDLTAMFGSSIADYVYTLESGAAGAGIAWLKKYGWFTKPYYPYKAATLESVKTSAHKTIGFNQWDEEWEVGGINSSTGTNIVGTNTIRAKNNIRIIPNTVYHYKCSAAAAARYYDASGNYLASYAAAITANSNFTTPSNAAFMRFVVFAAYGTTYNHDICINLHWDGERDGEHEPYCVGSYVFDGSVELRGLLKLDANNKLYYDGDEYTPDGTVKRKYEYRAYASGDESIADAITDGTHTVVKLSTPTTENATPYIEHQACFPNGTELFADGRNVEMPVEAVAEYVL